MSENVFHSMYPPFHEFNKYLTIFRLGSWTRSIILTLQFVSLLSNRKEGFLRLSICGPRKVMFAYY